MTLEQFLEIYRAETGPIVGFDYIDGFIRRRRAELERIIAPLVAMINARAARTRDREAGIAAGAIDRMLEHGYDPEQQDQAVEEWTVKRRTDANLAAMDLLRRVQSAPEWRTIPSERRTLLGYSGWGGLSIEAVKDRVPKGMTPDTFGLIHEYYTPKVVADEIARVVCPLLPGGDNEPIKAIEPAAGIGRLLRALDERACRPIAWTAIEYSQISAQILEALVPSAEVTQGSFEKWIVENPGAKGSYGLVLSNPPYGNRSLNIVDDPDRDFRERRAYAYFMRRGLDLLKPGGIGVFIVPMGFMSGEGAENVNLRAKILRRNHVLEAFRLPSELASKRDLFPGAGVVVDVIFFEARGGTLIAVDPDDQFIADGEYFERYPQNILGVVSERQRGKKPKTDDPDAKERRGWVVVTGDFTRLPDLQPRPMCTACVLRSPHLPAPKQRASRGVIRQAEANVEGLSSVLTDTVYLGLRVDNYLAYLAANDTEKPAALWLELSQALEAFVEANGNPWQDIEIRQLADSGNIGAQRFLSAFTKAGDLVEGLRSRPVVEKRYTGRPDDVVAQAEMLYRDNRFLTLTQLALFHAQVGGVMAPDSIKRTLLSAGWCLDGNSWNELVPRQVYLTGELWPKYDQAAARPPEDIQAANQARDLLTAIAPAVYEDIDNLSPRDSWIPLEIIAAWMKDTVNNRGPVHIEKRNGLVLPREVSLSEISGYLTTANELRKEQAELDEKQETLAEAKDEKRALKEQTPELTGAQYQHLSPSEIAARHVASDRKRELDKEMRRLEKSIALRLSKIKDIEDEASGSLTSDSIWVLGWLNHDMSTFKPPHSKDEKIDEVRLTYAKEWQSSFKAWLGSRPARRDQIRDVYNRTFKGFVQPIYEPEPLDIARYRPVNRSLHPWQVAGARRILANRGGLLAFDVGVGKTDTALAVIGKARQEGWVKRPVILVPTSIVWKWYKDIKRLYPDYRIGVVGSKRKTLTTRSEQGRRAAEMLKLGLLDQDGYERAITTSEPDTPEDRAAVWTALQAGQLDVVILSYDALQRTRMNVDAVVAYAEHSAAIQRSVEMQIRNMENRKKLSERAKAVKEHGMRAWIAQRMEINEGWKYDPGIAWDDIGIDMMVVDEAAAFKNLYLPEKREFGIPKFMGNAGDGSKRAWQLDFRLAAIRRKTGGAGVVLLTATPAKNSPLEYYNLIQYIDPAAFSRRGIGNPEQFIDRYLKIEPQNVIAVTGDTDVRSAVVGFLHLGELREIIFRYGEFASVPVINKRYPFAKIALPKLSFPEAVVDMDDEQEEKYGEMIEKIEAMIEEKDTSDLLGYMARLSLIAVHAQLDEGYGWNTALNGGISRRKVTQKSLDGWIERGWSVDDKPARGTAELDEVFEGDEEDDDAIAIKCDLPKPNSYSSPKFELVAANVWTKRDCGHIIFCENVATHQWIREVLVKRGIKRDRIACLNAIASPAAAERQRIAEDFNGDPDAGREPLYDVVIANSVAYEGIDLQRRTCSIHHVDFPWTPADLEQRNGRGYRQGNTLATFEIFYYRAERSLDGFRYNSIDGKARWQDELLYGEKRETNNPGAQSTLTPDQVLIAISRNPAKTIATLEKVRAEAEAAARKQVAVNASKTLLQANARMREARASDDPQAASRLRSEANDRIMDLHKISVDAWPWARWLGKLADVDYMIPPDGQAPVFEGLRVGKPSSIYPDQVDFYEFGRHMPNAEGGAVIGMRGLGAATWMSRTMSGVAAPTGSEQFGIRPGQLERGGAEWPDDSATTSANIRAELAKLGGKFDWPRFGWILASDAFLTQQWPRFRVPIMKAIADSAMGEEYLYPIDENGVLVLKGSEEIDKLVAENRLDALLPPTLAGFDHYLQLAPASRLSFQDLDAVAKFWWTRPFPRGLLTAAARAIRLARGEIVEGLPHPRDRLFLPHPDRRRPQIIEDRPSSKGGMRRRVAS